MKYVLFTTGFLFIFLFVFNDALYNQLWGPKACVSKNEKIEVIRCVFSSIYCTADAENNVSKLSYKDKFRADTINYQLLQEFNYSAKKIRMTSVKSINDFLVNLKLDTVQVRQSLVGNVSTTLLDAEYASLCVCTVFRRLNLANNKKYPPKGVGAAAISMSIPLGSNKFLYYYELGESANMNTGFVILQIEKGKVESLYQQLLTID